MNHIHAAVERPRSRREITECLAGAGQHDARRAGESRVDSDGQSHDPQTGLGPLTENNRPEEEGEDAVLEQPPPAGEVLVTGDANAIKPSLRKRGPASGPSRLWPSRSTRPSIPRRPVSPLYNEAWPVYIESATFREGATIGRSLIRYVLDNERLLDETSERKSNNCDRCELGTFCVRMLGRFTHAALSYKFISRYDVPRSRFDGGPVERTGMYDRDQSGGDDHDAASRFDGRGSRQCGVGLVKRGDQSCELARAAERGKQRRGNRFQFLISVAGGGEQTGSPTNHPRTGRRDAGGPRRGRPGSPSCRPRPRCSTPI